MQIRRNQHWQKQIRHKDAGGRCSATVVKVLDTGNQNMVQRLGPGKDQKGLLTPVSQSSQKKTRAMVAQSGEDGEKDFTCVEVEGTRSKSNLKKSGTEGSTNSDRAVYTVA